MMRHTVLALVAATITSAGWAAEQGGTSRYQAIGVGSGAALGGTAGGPVGLVLGAALGAWLGDRFDGEQTARTEIENHWRQAREEVAALNGLIHGSERQVALLESRLSQETRAMRDTVRNALNVQVLFRTGESGLTDETQTRLSRLAELLARMDGMLINIAGYADPRGDEEYNEQLSAARAVAVRDTLIKVGVPASRITVYVFGERHSEAEEADLDALALERRVELSLTPSGEPERIARQ